MDRIEIIGGIGPESTIDCYRLLIDAYRTRVPGGSYPSIIINSIDVAKLLRLAATDLASLTAYLSAEVERLTNAGRPSVRLPQTRRTSCSTPCIARQRFRW